MCESLSEKFDIYHKIVDRDLRNIFWHPFNCGPLSSIPGVELFR